MIGLQSKLDIIPALTESNQTLRFEKEKVDQLLEKALHRVKELEPLQDKLKELEEREEKSQNLIKALKTDGFQWKQKATQLTELNKKLSPEELKRLETDNGKLNKQVQNMQNNIKQQATQVNVSLTCYF